MKKTVDDYISLPYTRELVKSEDGWTVAIQELPGCVSVGESAQDALEMIDDALFAWLESAFDDNLDIPLPDSMSKKEYSGKFALRMPKSLHKKLSEQANREGVSLNMYLVFLLSEKNSLSEMKKILLAGDGFKIAEKSRSYVANHTGKN